VANLISSLQQLYVERHYVFRVLPADEDVQYRLFHYLAVMGRLAGRNRPELVLCVAVHSAGLEFYGPRRGLLCF
jgi:hypothetical protein